MGRKKFKGARYYIVIQVTLNLVLNSCRFCAREEQRVIKIWAKHSWESATLPLSSTVLACILTIYNNTTMFYRCSVYGGGMKTTVKDWLVSLLQNWSWLQCNQWWQNCIGSYCDCSLTPYSKEVGGRKLWQIYRDTILVRESLANLSIIAK